MTTMLEKAALAICNQIRDSHDLEPIKTLDLVENPNVFRRQARAALQAIRELTPEILSDPDMGWRENDDVSETWETVIDAILAEDKG